MSSPDQHSAPASVEPGAAFRQVHGRTVHGFALLLALGNRSVAAGVAAEALAAGAGRATELRHPERAAAWLRRRIVRRLPRRLRETSPTEERAALGPLRADRRVVDGFAALNPVERAALVAVDVERLDARDVEMIVGRSGASLERLLVRARRKYLAAQIGVADPAAVPDGPLVDRIRAVARRSMA